MYDDDDLDDFDVDDDDLDSGEGDSGDDDSVAALQLIHDLAAGHSGVRCSVENL